MAGASAACLTSSTPGLAKLCATRPRAFGRPPSPPRISSVSLAGAAANARAQMVRGRPRHPHRDLARHEDRQVDAPAVSCRRRCPAFGPAPCRRGARIPLLTRRDKQLGGYHNTWLDIAARAALPDDVTPHILRHSFASEAGDLGYSELTIAALIGHKAGSITSKYVHTADAVLLKAADDVAQRIEQKLGFAKAAGKVVRPDFAKSA